MKRIALTLVAIVVLLLVIGLILPSTFKVQRSIDIAATAEKIYPLIADPREWKKWSAWNARDPAMKIVYSGPPSGAGSNSINRYFARVMDRSALASKWG